MNTLYYVGEEGVVIVNNECICNSQLNKPKNTHCTQRNIDLIVTTKKGDEGIIVFEDSMAIACFDIKYCPICGKKLSAKETKLLTESEELSMGISQ